ncbi:MAG: archaeal proteasome endopeptidase complex subunit alpha [Haloarculaceae archaeon]
MMQSNNQQAYDRGVTVFSPDGRLYQVEYAREAVERGSATVGVRTSESVVLASLGRRRSPLVEPESIEKIHDMDGRLGIASAGHVADARRLVDFGRQHAQRERLRYDEAPGVETIAKAIADFVQESTQTGGSRPFGAALLVGGVTDEGPRLYEVDPSGTPYEWRATAVGSGSDDIRAFLEDGYDAGIGTTDGTSLALRALAEGTDEDLTPEEIGLATLDAEGYRKLDRERRASALEDAGLGAS